MRCALFVLFCVLCSVVWATIEDPDVLALKESAFFKLFRRFPDSLTLRVSKAWPKMSTMEKLPYLFDSLEVEGLIAEFVKLSRSSNDGHGGDVVVTWADVTTALSDFQSEQTLQTFFSSCDGDYNGHLGLEEYFICRGQFSSSGSEHTLNEFDAREETLFYDFSNTLRSSKVQPHFSYDENGIIIDEEN